MEEDIKLAELLNAKFCHDMAGPIGAVSNGMDFLDDSDPEMQEKALELVKSSAKQAVARLQYYRQVYGSIAEDISADISNIQSIANAYFSDSKIKVTWNISQDIEIPNRVGKLLLNLLSICSHSLIMGGEIDLNLESLDNIEIKGSGRKVKMEDSIMAILTSDKIVQDITTRNINVFYTRKILDKLGCSVDIKASEQGIVFKLLN